MIGRQLKWSWVGVGRVNRPDPDHVGSVDPTYLWVVLAAALACPSAARAADWPQWGGHNDRNMASDEKGLPAAFSIAAAKGDRKGQAAAPASGIKWSVKLGSQTFSTPAVAGGRIFVGTNDAGLSDPRLKKTQGGLIMCLEEATGRLLWQLPTPRLRTRDKSFNFDQGDYGICSTPTVDGDRVYVVTNRGEVLCLDVAGQANGNDGPFKDEGQYMVGWGELPAKPGRFDQKTLPPPPAAVTVGPADGDIVWMYDMLSGVDTWPQDAVDCSILVVGDYIYVCTSNGVDRSHKSIPSPKAPDLIVMDKRTGEVVAANDPPIGTAIFHGEWSSPALADVNGKPLVIWGGGDGFCYAFDPRPAPAAAGRRSTLRQVWSFDCNVPGCRFRGGKPVPYNKGRDGPSEVIGTPVFWKNRVYVTVGQDPRHGPGRGCLSCIDATKTGDISTSGRVWQYDEIGRSLSTPAIADGLVFVGDYGGAVHCLDADTGQVCWTHDTGAHIWGSPLVVDGKVYVGDDRGTVTVFALARQKKVLAENSLEMPIYATPVAANGRLYIASQARLYAIQTAP